MTVTPQLFPVRYRVNLFRYCYLCLMSTNYLYTNYLYTNCLFTNCLSTNCLFTNCLFTNCLFINRLYKYPCAYTCPHVVYLVFCANADGSR